MKRNLLILESDKKYARNRIAELEQQIQDLGPEFRSAFTQTSETWHDNAPFEAVRDQQTQLAAERHQLKEILTSSLPSIPKQKPSQVGIGSKVTLQDNKTGAEAVYLIAGDWTPHAGDKLDGALIMSRISPLADEMINKKVGDDVKFRSHDHIIKSIEYIDF